MYKQKRGLLRAKLHSLHLDSCPVLLEIAEERPSAVLLYNRGKNKAGVCVFSLCDNSALTEMYPVNNMRISCYLYYAPALDRAHVARVLAARAQVPSRSLFVS